MENAHSASFLTMVSVILVGSLFNPFLTLFKLEKFLYSKEYHNINVWIALFFMVWLPYHGTTSVRYLTPIIAPLSAISVAGVFSVYRKIGGSEAIVKIPLLLIIGTNFIFLYPFLPLRILFLSFHHRFFLYHISPLLILSYAILPVLFLRIVVPHLRHLITQKHDAYRHGIVVSLVLLISVAPIATQTAVYIQSGFDLRSTRYNLVYDNRETVHELATFLSNDMNQDVISIGVNIPGLHIFSGKPFIDLYFVTRYLNTSDFLQSRNETKLLEQVEDFNISHVITLTQDHPYYTPFNESFVPRFPILNTGEISFLLHVYENREFEVWRVE